ncbi:MAG: hypothetical protein OER95_04765, partial [Acidimicrobiia bacterium]|nr:hypothetical protein [Acidimicrobiia bacterium]
MFLVVALLATQLVLAPTPSEGASWPLGSTTTTFPAGAYVIDMGQPQTIETGLKPYGLVYDLMINGHIPVTWSIGEDKVKDGFSD